MKPIEPGCLCVIIRSHFGNNGMCVTAVRKLPPFSEGWNEPDIWEIDRPIRIKTLGGEFIRDSSIPEYGLLPIDGHEETEEIEEAATA